MQPALIHGEDVQAARERTLSPEEQITVCTMLAHYQPPKAILRVLRAEGNTRATADTITHYKHSPKWQSLINRLREEYLANIQQVAIANTRLRLDALQDQFDTVQGQTTRSEFSASRMRAEVREILKQAQSEMTDRRNSALTLMSQIMTLSDEELEKKREQVLERVRQLGGHPHAVRRPSPPTGTGSSHEAQADVLEVSTSDGAPSVTPVG